jgi:uncharacterized membrane protein
MKPIASISLRLRWAAAAVLLLLAEVCIALLARDRFVRPYLGDALVVMLIHCALRSVFLKKPKPLALYVFVFACFMEAMQAAHLLALLGLEHIRLLRIIVGTRFSWGDILCYAAGCLAVGLGEAIAHHVKPKSTD